MGQIVLMAYAAPKPVPSADPRAAMDAAQRELRAVDPTVAVENVRTLDEIRTDSLASRTFATRRSDRGLARGLIRRQDS